MTIVYFPSERKWEGGLALLRQAISPAARLFQIEARQAGLRFPRAEGRAVHFEVSKVPRDSVSAA
jgi:hypothetical protein